VTRLENISIRWSFRPQHDKSDHFLDNDAIGLTVFAQRIQFNITCVRNDRRRQNIYYFRRHLQLIKQVRRFPSIKVRSIDSRSSGFTQGILSQFS
jgi:hypothetical protein